MMYYYKCRLHGMYLGLFAGEICGGRDPCYSRKPLWC